MVEAEQARVDMCAILEANQTASDSSQALLYYTWHYSCSSELQENADLYLFVVVVISYIILLFLSTRVNRRKWWCCWGRPAIMSPMNMLDGYENRLAYCAAFGCMSYELTGILYNPWGRFTTFGLAYWLRTIPTVYNYPVIRLMLLLCQVSIVSFMFYPMFAALGTKYKFAGAIIGLLNSVYRVINWSWLASCRDTQFDSLSSIERNELTVEIYKLAILTWPCIVCVVILSLCYIGIIVDCIREKNYSFDPKPAPIALEHHFEHVKLLLGKEKLPWSHSNLNHMSMFSKEKIIANCSPKRMAGFKFPTRVLATFTLVMLGIYQIGTEIMALVYVYLRIARSYVNCLDFVLPGFLHPYLTPYTALLFKYIDIAIDAWVGLLVIDCILAVFAVYHSCLSYRKHTLRVYAGNRSMFPASWVRQSNPALMTAASRHAGLQIAYTIWGFIIIHVFLYIIVMAVILVLVMPPLEFGYWEIVIQLSQTAVASLILSQIFNFIQYLLNRFFFLQDKTEATDDFIPLALDNRRAWDNVSFFFFFWTLFLGIISALMRIIRGVFLGVFFIPRIDRPVLMKGFEVVDNGYHAYLSLLTAINAHDHPVVKVFVKILQEGLNEKRKHMKAAAANHISYDIEGNGVEMATQSLNSSPRNTYQGSKRARYFWFLAYSLIHNPDLLNYRKYGMDVKDDEDGQEMGFKMLLPGVQRMQNTAGGKAEKQVGLAKHVKVLATKRKKEGVKTSNIYDGILDHHKFENGDMDAKRLHSNGKNKLPGLTVHDNQAYNHGDDAIGKDFENSGEFDSMAESVHL